MYLIVEYIIVAILGTITGLIFKKLNKNTLREFYFIFLLGIMSIAVLIIILLSLLHYIPLHLNLEYSILLFIISIFTTIYLYTYNKIFKNKNVTMFLVSIFIIASIFSSTIFSNNDYNPNNPSIIINPQISTTPLFIDYVNILENSSMPKPNVVLNPQLNDYENQTYSYLMLFINDSNYIQVLSNKLLCTLSDGNITISKLIYSNILERYSELINYYNKINFYSELLSSYSYYYNYEAFLGTLQNNLTQINSLLQNEEHIMNIIDSAQPSAHIPDILKISYPKEIPFNTSVQITGKIEPASSYNYSINGRILIQYLNNSEYVNVSNGKFEFFINVSQYINNVRLTIIYSGDKNLLPALSTRVLHVNIIPTILKIKLLNHPYNGETLKINGNVTGTDRKIIISMLNLSREYIESNNFTIYYPLPTYLTNSSYQVNITVLPKGNYAPTFTQIYFTPKLYPINMSVIVPSTWIIPKSLTIKGRIWLENNTANYSLNHIRVFVFIGNSRYEVLTHNGYFTLNVKPKMTLFYGKQPIFVEADPQYGLYRVIVKTTTLVYNPVLYALLGIIISLGVFILVLVRKRRKPKTYEITEVPIWRRSK